MLTIPSWYHRLAMSDRLKIISDRSRALHEIVSDNDILLFGMTGSGKTTFVQNMQRYTPVRYVSLGAITRDIAAFEDDHDVVSRLREPKAWPLETVSRVLDPYLAIQQPFVLDGAPRRVSEAEWFNGECGQRPYGRIAITLVSDEATIYRRLDADESRASRPETTEHIQERVTTFLANHQKVMSTLRPNLDDEVAIEVKDKTPLDMIDEMIEQLR